MPFRVDEFRDPPPNPDAAATAETLLAEQARPRRDAGCDGVERAAASHQRLCQSKKKSKSTAAIPTTTTTAIPTTATPAIPATTATATTCSCTNIHSSKEAQTTLCGR